MECENCGGMMSFDEIDWGCFSCGWQVGSIPESSDFYEGDEDEEDEDDI